MKNIWRDFIKMVKMSLGAIFFPHLFHQPEDKSWGVYSRSPTWLAGTQLPPAASECLLPRQLEWGNRARTQTQASSPTGILICSFFKQL